MDWTEGYNSEVEYTCGYYPEQSPAQLNLVCAAHGVEPVPLGDGFTYCELGFGRGLTVTALAAAHPRGRFYAADFNPAHVSGARELARAAGLDNLTLLEASFETLADGGHELPGFDFITLHGIYTWVTPANQAHIVRFIDRYLKPGGVVYVSYNAMPGWTAALPLQRLLVEFADTHPDRGDAQFQAGTRLLQRMDALQAGYFTGNPGAKQRLAAIEQGDRHYLVHEYMHRQWQPLYHADVVRDLAAAKLDFAGSSDLSLRYPDLVFDAERLGLIGGMKTPVMRETMKDYLLNTGFRKDVFVRGARRMTSLRQAECLGAATLHLTRPRGETTLKLKLTFGELEGVPGLYEPVLDALAQRPHSIAELRALPALAGQSHANVTQIAVLLTASGQTAIGWGAAGDAAGDTQAALALNRALARLARYGDDHKILCSPALGGGLQASHIERLVYLALSEGLDPDDSDGVGRRVWQAMREQGRYLQKDGVVLQSDADNLAALAPTVRRALTRQLPLWRQLGII
ncbi:class I SAM-dependent methyltransferase [Pseudoduganella namucuonensis]|uniref:Methyltransferase domain-containing protein n=1 Tax=Pseudoduganella namucuonensis TaxID=1035707 RepID=A0A1I7FLY4_9BURK|nr:class I SAM-dependent methyltransferase [Pseudoduganella namucuonensis]SFU37193.1 Methyltransferase domain-containing protein [Pseudoduganella namucuonensis]